MKNIIIKITLLVFVLLANQNITSVLGQSRSGAFIDQRDGKTYRWIRIGDQKWMAENLNYDAGQGSWCYNDNTRHCNSFGRLYYLEAAVKACPPGWRLPSRADWNKLTNYLGGESHAGTKLKARNGWHRGRNGTNDYGFSALPGGFRNGGNYFRLGEWGVWWSINTHSPTNAGIHEIRYNSPSVYRYTLNQYIGTPYPRGYSVRCVRD